MIKLLSKILLICIFAFAFLIRVIPYWSNAIKDGKIYYADPDSCYHLRRIELSAKHFPGLLIVDNFAGPKSSNFIIWPPLYDWFLSSLWYFLSLVGIKKEVILFVVAFLNPIISLFTSYFIYKLAKEILPHKFYALTSCIIFLFFPRNIIYSSFANIDHHTAEVFSMVFLFYQLIKFMKIQSKTEIIKLSIAMALSSLIWTGAYFFAFCIILVFLAVAKKIESRIYIHFHYSLLLTSLLIFPFSYMYSIYNTPLIKMDVFSLFQSLIYLAYCFLIFAYLKIINKEIPFWSHNEEIFYYISSSLGGLAFFAVIPEVVKGIEYLLKKNPKFMSFVSESESIFKMHGLWTYKVVFLYLSYFIILLPIFYIILFKFKERINKIGFAFLFVLTPIFFLLVVLQKKFSFHFTVLFTLLIGLNLYFLWEKINRKIGRLSFIIIILLIISMFYPCFPVLKFGNDNLYMELFSIMSALDLLKEKAGPFVDDFNNKGFQDYYVLSEWNLGHWIQYYANKPVVADNFGKDEHMKIIAEIFLSYSEEEVLKLLRRYRIKYILVRDYKTSIFNLPIIIGRMPEEYFRSYLEGNKLYISPVGGLTFGFKLCENPTSLIQEKNPLNNHLKLIGEWEDKHKVVFRDGLRGFIRLYEVMD